MKCRGLLLCVVGVLWATAVGAGEPITIGETLTLESKIMGETRTLLVSTPPGYEQSQERYPVLYMTDGDAHLTHTRGTVDFLARNGLMPQVIVVGVTNTDRTRDLTPTRGVIVENGGTEREFPTSGGSAKFLDFFAGEVFPYIEENYRTSPLRLFSGHSFGGLFALEALVSRPEMFDAVISVSPSLIWDHDLPIRQVTKFLDDRNDLQASLFVVMANEEEGDPRPNRLDQLEQALESSSVDGFRWKVMRFPDETHGSVVLRAHYWGLRDAFADWPVPTDPETGAFEGSLDDLIAHYESVSKRYGYRVIPPEAFVNRLGYQFLGRGDTARAIIFFEHNVRLYPESANVYDSLGEALEHAGEIEKAAASYATAVEKAEAIGDDRIEVFTINRDRATAALAEQQQE
jgi:hypothetical protein